MKYSKTIFLFSLCCAGTVVASESPKPLVRAERVFNDDLQRINKRLGKGLWHEYEQKTECEKRTFFAKVSPWCAGVVGLYGVCVGFLCNKSLQATALKIGASSLLLGSLCYLCYQAGQCREMKKTLEKKCVRREKRFNKILKKHLPGDLDVPGTLERIATLHHVSPAWLLYNGLQECFAMYKDYKKDEQNRCSTLVKTTEIVNRVSTNDTGTMVHKYHTKTKHKYLSNNKALLESDKPAEEFSEELMKRLDWTIAETK